MRETKDQKIERLEKIIDEQKKEITQIKKDRKRLNYTVERLENTLKRHSSKEDKKKIAHLEKEVEKLKETVEDKTKKISHLCAVGKEACKRLMRMKDYADRWDNTFAKKRLAYFIGGLEEDIDGNRLYDPSMLWCKRRG